MDSSFPMVPTGDDRSPARGGGGGLDRFSGATAPLHQAAQMGLDGGEKLRQECWEMIGQRTRERLMELAGGVIDWYARRDGSSLDGRPYAVVFGDRGLAIAEPRISTEHRPVYAISAFVFEPGSLRHVQVDHRPPPHTPASGPALASGARSPVAPVDGLSAADRGLLGNLPPRTQELLQTPFTSGQRVLRCNWAYEGYEHQLTMFMVFLAGARDVTVACGTKVIPAGHSDATAHWSLTCYRASVARRIGR
ncbi:hypothetical protein GCM10023195_87380 [Actinoallomurus liliacearum]|uniref:Uncharacterized protein n=1 Tax=Actinoallomurus liliacearum TaxID=1080073 RepID=A0ABP8TY94_9ACTN